jgi:hypothetical protein
MYSRIESGAGMPLNLDSHSRSVRDAAGENPRITVVSDAFPRLGKRATAGAADSSEMAETSAASKAIGRRMGDPGNEAELERLAKE